MTATPFRVRFCHEGDPADVGVAVLLGEAEPLGQMRADDVSVEDLHSEPPLAEIPLHDVRDRRLPRAGQPREPQREPAGHPLPPSM
jgi:hypothetical protein